MNKDKQIVTAIVGEASQNVIKVWCSSNLTLLRTFRHHTEHIQNLKPNPIYPNILVSSGCDGLVVIWDILAGKKLAEVLFPTVVETVETISVHDIKWAADGMQIACCDSQGTDFRITVCQCLEKKSFTNFKHELAVDYRSQRKSVRGSF
jgi:WD40 repeat protein